MENLLAAIVDDERARVAKLLKADAGFATRHVAKPRLFNSEKLAHWLYVGDTALHLAAAGHRVEIVNLLLNAGADPNSARNHRWGTPLHYAADGYVISPAWHANRQVKTIRRLLQAGADINAQDKNGASPLHRAVRTRCSAAVACLLKARANPTLKNNPGSTPFHLAVQNTGRGGSGAAIAVAEQRRIIKEFLSSGVSTALKDGKGKSVLDCAKSEWIRELLV
jgi:Ankyrin repeats (3 copies)/Ankyrin repeat